MTHHKEKRDAPHSRHSTSNPADRSSSTATAPSKKVIPTYNKVLEIEDSTGHLCKLEVSGSGNHVRWWRKDSGESKSATWQQLKDNEEPSFPKHLEAHCITGNVELSQPSAPIFSAMDLQDERIYLLSTGIWQDKDGNKFATQPKFNWVPTSKKNIVLALYDSSDRLVVFDLTSKRWYACLVYGSSDLYISFMGRQERGLYLPIKVLLVDGRDNRIAILNFFQRSKYSKLKNRKSRLMKLPGPPTFDPSLGASSKHLPNPYIFSAKDTSSRKCHLSSNGKWHALDSNGKKKDSTTIQKIFWANQYESKPSHAKVPGSASNSSLPRDQDDDYESSGITLNEHGNCKARQNRLAERNISW